MKRITALITVLTILFSMAVPAWAADSYVAVSVGKPISALVNADATNDAKANDDNMGSWYVGSKATTSNALTIDLEKKYILSHITALILNQASYSISVSNDAGFGTSTELQLNGTQWDIPSDKADVGYRYVRLSFETSSSSDVWVFDFKVYTTEENKDGAGAQIDRPEEFTEELIKISEGKSAVSKYYGTGGFGTNVAANVVDSDASSQFISCAERTNAEWMTIDLGEAALINKITSVFTVQRSYAVYVTNTAYGEKEEFADGIQLNETSAGSKVFVLPDEYKNTAFRYVRFRFEGDAPNTGSDTEQNVYIKDISVYQSSRDAIYNAVAKKSGTLTDGNTETAVTVANNTVIDLLTPSYIHSYELLGSDKDNVTIKGSLFNTSVDNMTVIPKNTTTDEKYRFIAIVSDSGESVSLNEVKVWSFFTDVVTPWTKDGKNCSVTVTNTSHKDDRTYTLSAAAYDEYGAVLGVKTVTETLASGASKTASLEVDGADLAKKVVCTVERNGLLVSAPAIFVDGVNVSVPTGTPYLTAPDKDFETAVAKTDYFDGLAVTVSNTGGMVDSDMLTFSVYNSADELLAKDAVLANGTFKYRLPGDAAAGAYKAVLSVTDAMGNNMSAEYPFTKTAPTETELNTAIADFANAATAADFQTAYQTHYVTNGTISFSDIPEAEALLTSGIGDSFMKMMSARTLWKKNAGTTLTAEDIRDCMKAAVVENALENSRANAATVLTKYASVLDNVFDGKQNNTYTAEIFKTGATTNDELIYNMKIAAALSQMKNASSETIENVLKTYSSILSVDLTAISNSGVDSLLVARRLDNTIPDSYKDGLSTEITQILQENAVITPTPTPTPGGGGGGGGGGGASDNYTGEKTDVIVKEDYEPSPSPEIPEKTETETVSFSDVADNYWAAASIKKLAAAGIISGRGDGSYDPNSEVSRAEYATMLVKAFKLISDPEQKPEFTDCKVSDWFYPFVDAAVSNDIVSGISKTEFDPVSSIRRQDACVMSYNMMIYKNYLKYFAGKTFTDSHKVSAYATDAVNMLSGSGVVSGFEDGSFGPYELLSRAQAAVVIDKLMTLLGEEV